MGHRHVSESVEHVVHDAWQGHVQRAQVCVPKDEGNLEEVGLCDFDFVVVVDGGNVGALPTQVAVATIFATLPHVVVIVSTGLILISSCCCCEQYCGCGGGAGAG